ncbi:Eukaryotic translation initiation factor 3 subunit D domain-containing protein [Rozella allomycis CSF55]|uniref:Eukaryotic translation initiation factor 3 subunit D domain-containing protein n=1 Tax=Rozella allomycis (strain CSF55) TaxID=988480 RepID=A0A075ASH7_ROZAC|nr:Eukaryotic translation initiation factor 3 subunit D domain-containing protein [Rozella allomycis CSF55]|eukprot:EPZ33213.1 Eukaryotic translation initiation factor 3 subunit D domain-containing protein [Rozella allomycis CSF55]
MKNSTTLQDLFQQEVDPKAIEKFGKIANWIGAVDSKGKKQRERGISVDDDLFGTVDRRSQKSKYATKQKVVAPKKVSAIPLPSTILAVKKKSTAWKTNVQSKGKFIDIDPKWELLMEFERDNLIELQYSPEEGKTLLSIGSLPKFDGTFDKISIKNPKQLLEEIKTPKIPSVVEDPTMADFISKRKAKIYTTDNILSALMSHCRSTIPFDFKIIRKDDYVIIDAREGSILNFETLLESTAAENLDFGEENYNSPLSLIDEVTKCHHKFSAQVKGLASNDSQINYRLWDFGDNVQLLCRTSLDASYESEFKSGPVSTHCLVEIDSRVTKVDFKQKADSQRGAILGSEMLNNPNKLARWLFQSILADAKFLKIGYVSRKLSRDNTKHVILGTETYAVDDFAVQIHMDVYNGWGTVKALSDVLLNLPVGEYVMVRTPRKGGLRIYKANEDDK